MQQRWVWFWYNIELFQDDVGKAATVADARWLWLKAVCG